MNRTLRLLVVATVALLAGGFPARSATEIGPLGGCPNGTYRFLAYDSGRVREIDIRDGRVEVAPGCKTTAVQLTTGERKTDVSAAWPSCEGWKGKVALEGRIHGSFCDRFDGRLDVGSEKPLAVHGALVTCQAKYPQAAERTAAIDRAVIDAARTAEGDPWKDAQSFARLYYAVQARLGCALD